MVLGLNRKSIFESIEISLEKERDAIMSGDFEALGVLIGDRESLVDQLENDLSPDDVPEIKTIESLQAKARRNAKLIRAAIDGVSAANKQIAEIEAAHSKLSTYSENGQIRDVLKPRNTVTKKA